MAYNFEGGSKQFDWQTFVNYLANVLGSASLQTEITNTQQGMQTVDQLAQQLAAVAPCPGSSS
jgi:hypothetical protein